MFERSRTSCPDSARRRRQPFRRRAGKPAWHVAFTAATVLLAVVAPARRTLAEDSVKLEVSADQEVSLSGESPSLRAVVEELCDRAGIELRGYGAPDREFHGSYHDVPATGLLPRLLRDESHVVGLTTDEKHHTRIAWLRVLGEADPAAGAPRPMAVASAAARLRAATAQAPASPFQGEKQKILDLVEPIFELDPADREAKIAEVAKALSNEDSTRAALFGAAETDIADDLIEHPDAARVLGQLSAALTSVDARRDLGTILRKVVAIMRERAAEH